MHNTKKANLEFNLTFCETNLRYLLGDETPDMDKINFQKSEIERLKKEIDNLSES